MRHRARYTCNTGSLAASPVRACAPVVYTLPYRGSSRPVSRVYISARMQNANLVLTASREGRAKGKEPTGEPETLSGRRLPKMGDRAMHAAPDELEELKKRKAKCASLAAMLRCTHSHHSSCLASGSNRTE